MGLFVNINLQTKAQFLNDEFCGNKEIFNIDVRKKPWKGANSFLYDYLKEINYSERYDSVRYLVPLKFWIYQDSVAGTEIADSSLKRMMNELNYYQQLNKTGFRYYICAIRRINKKKRLKLGYFLEAPLQTMIHKQKACINVYLTETIKKRVWGEKYIVRGTFNTLSNTIILQYNTSSTGLAHEIGHYFGLLHPHRNYNRGKAKQECVSRTRTFHRFFKRGLICEKNGDGLADTPAEPKLSYLVDNNCNFIGSALKDNWGDNYQSNTDNIMSYPTHYRCRKAFTLGQKAVMLYSASQNKYANLWTTALPENKVYQFDEFEPDNSLISASVLKINELQTHSFHRLIIPTNSKELVFDDEDWLKIELKDRTKKYISIHFIAKQTFLKAVSIYIYDEDKILIKEEDILKSANIDIPISNFKKDYYILIKNKNKPINNALFYQISVSQK